MRCIAAAILLILSAAEVQSGIAALSQAQLPDQRGGRDSLGAHRGSAVVVIVVNARRLGTVERWARDLEARFPAVHLLTVADVNETRPSSLERVTDVLARRVPPDVSVLIDMDRMWATALKLDTAEPNLVVVSANGAVVAQLRGRWSADRAGALAASLSALEKSA